MSEMHLTDLQGILNTTIVELICNKTDILNAGKQVRIRGEGKTDALIMGAGNIIGVRAQFATESYANEWKKLESQQYLAVVSDTRKNRITVNAVSGFELKERGNDLSLALTDQAVTTDADRQDYLEKYRKKIMDEYVLRLSGESYIVAARHIQGEENTFVLTCGSKYYSIKEIQGTSPEAEKILAVIGKEKPFRKDNYRIEIWKCGLQIRDMTSAGEVDLETKLFLDRNMEKYLSAWQQYADIEYDSVARTAENAGELEFNKVRVNGKTATFRIKNPEQINSFFMGLDEVGMNREVDVSRTYPDNSIRNPAHGRMISANAEKKEVSVLFRAVDTAFSVGPLGTITSSIHPAKVQYDRRIFAIRRVLTRKSAKPELAALIAGKGVSDKAPKRSMQVKLDLLDQADGDEKQKKWIPTEMQRRAIEVAIRTPDFAIIQGPPGTGKTKVINAIIRLLSQQDEDPKLFFGQNLMTAYQRDATLNLAKDLEIYGLPVITYKGGDQTLEEDDDSTFLSEDTDSDDQAEGNDDEDFDYDDDEDGQELRIKGELDENITKWIREKREKLGLENELASRMTELDMLIDRLRILRIGLDRGAGSPEFCAGTLTAYLGHLQEYMKSELKTDENGQGKTLLWAEANKFCAEGRQLLGLIPEDDGELEEIGAALEDQRPGTIWLPESRKLELAENLPCSERSMSDDGAGRISRLFFELSGEQKPEVQRILAALKKQYGEEVIRYDRVQILRNALLAQLKSVNRLLPNDRLRGKVRELLDRTLWSIEAAELSDEDQIMSRYLGAFYFPDVIGNSILQFMTAIAATHQKTDSSEVLLGKQVTRDPVFDNVLIDEAARSCPPDLIIPLSCAKERMILVGDHKQLPQFINENVYKDMKLEREEKRLLIKEQSMFEHLKNKVQELEKVDGIPRFIQLDKQFRMAKTLGDLVSECFYEGTLDSPRGNDDRFYGLELPGLHGYHLMWLNVPLTIRNRECRNEKKSYCRMAEAEECAHLLRNVLMSQTGVRNEDEALTQIADKKYKFGIITFYNGQKELLEHMLEEDSLLRGLQSQGQLKLGTVDSFQGMEFDVVILSLVRSHSDYEKVKNPFGFTKDDHRLCVALSRAKRCMIIVGDSKMMLTESAERDVPSLVKFYKLCENKEITDARVFKNQDLFTER